MMPWRLFSALVAISIWASLAGAQTALGAPLSAPFEVLLGYESSYSQGGRSVVHRGVDLSASEGDTVSSPLTGRVSFAGRVPAPGGGSRNVVTIEFGDGLRITLLPLDRITVKAGQQVSQGDSIGAVAVVAGESTPAPHLHVSVRKGETYIDPMPFLPVQTAMTAQPEGVLQESPAPDFTTEPQASPQPTGATAPQASPHPVSGTIPHSVSQTAIQTGQRIVTSTLPNGIQNAAPTLSKTSDGATNGNPLVGATEALGAERANTEARSLNSPSEGGFQRAVSESEAFRQGVKQSTQLPISEAGLVIVAIAALIGLMPIVRSGIEASTEDTSISTSEQFAAAVGR